MDVQGQNTLQTVTVNWASGEIYTDPSEPPVKIQKLSTPYRQQVTSHSGNTTTYTFIPDQSLEGVSDPGQFPVQHHPASKQTLSALRSALMQPPSHTQDNSVQLGYPNMSSGRITRHNSNNSANNNKEKGDRKMDGGERKAAGTNDNARKGNKNENNPKAADKVPAKVLAGTPITPTISANSTPLEPNKNILQNPPPLPKLRQCPAVMVKVMER